MYVVRVRPKCRWIHRLIRDPGEVLGPNHLREVLPVPLQIRIRKNRVRIPIATSIHPYNPMNPNTIRTSYTRSPVLRFLPSLLPPLCAAIFAAAQSGHAGNVALNDGGTTTLWLTVRDTNLSFTGQQGYHYPVSLPFSTSVSLTEGASHVQADFILNDSGFSSTSSGARAGLLDSRSTLQPQFFFSVSVDTVYAIAGAFSADDPGLTGSAVVLTATLKDLDTSATLYHSHQSSLGVVDEAFALGGMSGNLENELSGSSSGILLAGHQYSFSYATTIYASQTSDAASFLGSFALTLGDQQSVPDVGSSIALSLIGFGVLGILRKRIS